MKKIDINEIQAYGKFAVILKCLLAKNKITQGELAKATNLSQATITHYVKGKYTPSQSNLEKIAKFLNVSPRVFYGDIDEYAPFLNSVESRFATRLNGLIHEKKITQEQFAKEIGVSRQTVNLYVNGKQLPMADVMIKIARYFDKPMSYFLTIPEEVEAPPTKIYVTNMPVKKSVCPFIKNDITMEYYECSNGGMCDLKDGVCSHLIKLDLANGGANGD